MSGLNGKVAVITGAGSGIGLSLARALAAQGCKLVLADVRADAVTSVCESLANGGAEAVAYGCDISQQASVEALADGAWERFGQVDLVFCNAGVMPPNAPFLDADENSARWVFEINYFGTRTTAQIFGARLIAQGAPAQLIITGSENSLCVPAPLMADYNASKHAVHGLADMIRREMPDFIAVRLACPGIVKTCLPATVALRPARFGGPVEDPFGGDMPLGMNPDDVARHIVSQLDTDAFYLLTHHCVRYMVVERYQELLHAFDAQTSADDGSDEIDTRKLMAGMAPAY